nr:hypothetical protein [Tanacetum cinerariifolium]
MILFVKFRKRPGEDDSEWMHVPTWHLITSIGSRFNLGSSRVRDGIYTRASRLRITRIFRVELRSLLMRSTFEGYF